jgi:threonine/homoserine/homoserine lactone efflux protein
MPALFSALIVLEIIPGPGTMIVLARTLSQDCIAGMVTSAGGIVAGYFVFIGLAAFGLSTLSQSLGELFLITQYTGAVYLFWLEVIIAAVFFHEFSKTTSHTGISVP